VHDYTRANRAFWNAWTNGHHASEHHQDVARFQAMGSSLRSIERDELGDVTGKSLLHLQCNMGSETLSWARLGARTTGVDLADAAIARARALAEAAGLDARFIQADLYALPDVLDERFDIVFTSYGALGWMADLPRWAHIAARYVRPGGTLYIVDMHPFSNMLTPDPRDPDGTRFQVGSPYFHAPEPTPEAVATPGAQPDDAGRATLYVWSYGLGEVITSLLAAGLQLEYVHEFPIAHYQRFPALVRGADGWWRWPAPNTTLPLLFSIRAHKPEAMTTA
jgi:SAM-dependent methyltransferase